MHDDLRFLIASAVLGGKPVPDILYLGLTLERDFTDPTLASVSKRELTAPSYRRIEISSDKWSITRHPPKAAANVTITNKGVDTWPTVRGAFIATSQDNSGLLIAFAPFSEGRVAFPGDSIVFPIAVEF